MSDSTHPPATGDGELEKLLKAYRLASMYEQPYAAKRIKAYVSAAVQEAVEKAAQLADARAADYADSETDSASHRYTNGVVRLVAENIAVSIRSLVSEELHREKK